MSKASWVRALISLAAAGVVALSGVEHVQQPNAVEAATPAERVTLRVGMWTLWRDRVITLADVDHAAVRTCEQCAPKVLDSVTIIHAKGDALAVSTANATSSSAAVWLSGAVKFTAHGESLTIRNPVSITARNGVLVIVVTLPVEDYVQRVVASESGPADSMESLKALAVVVRTFALHEAHGHADYDLCDSTHCQLLHWGGNPYRGAAAHAAALETAGETLWFQGQRALGYFNKDCGGRSASPEEIWPQAKRVPYLISRPDSYCTASGGKQWSSEITRDELTSALATHGLAHAGWQSLTVARRGESGRAVKLRLDGTEISAEAFVLAVGETLGWSRVPSTWFEVSRQGEEFQFHGRGWGHGVGLCQTGAAVMAGQGRSEQEILQQYFPGAEAADEATGRAWQRFTGSGFTLESLSGNDASFLPDLARARAEASEQSGLDGSLSIMVRAFESTEEFRQATLAPGWVAAFTEGNWIGTQPLRTLTARKLLAGTMRHEFLHALVEHEAGPGAPLWLREGLVEIWSENERGANSATALRSPPMLKIGEVDAALTHAGTEAESEAAHRAAAWYAAQLLARNGREQVVGWLRSSVPAGAIAGLRQR